jgi:3-hydroxyisobutyrate dehydrogenase-like beta-hydroxyacid dehydrogenase
MGSDARLTVAMIGLGNMGGPIADRVIAAGHDVRVFDISEDALAPRVAAGATRAASAAAAADGAAVVGIVVFDDDQVRAVLGGPDGVLASAAPGTVVAVHSTVRVASIHELAATAAATGVRVIDAGVSGGATGAIAGTLVTMVGGDADALEVARPVFESFSAEIVHAGELGAGMALKISRNLVGYVIMAGAFEGLRLAHAAGLDAATFQRVLEGTKAALDAQLYAPIAFGGPEPLTADAPDDERAFLAQVWRLGEKDLHDALVLAADLGVTIPVAEESRDRFHEVMRFTEPPR